MQTLTERRFPDCPERLDGTHLRQFQEEGYLAFENVLSAAEVETARAAITALARDLLEEARQGRAEVVRPGRAATGNYSGVRIHRRENPFNLHFEPGVEPFSLDPERAELGLRKLHGYHQEHPFFQELVHRPKVKGVVEALLGHPAVLFGDMALLKAPFIGSPKPWHQDDAYFSYLPLESIVTAWIALDDATEENGCMQVLPGWHRKGAFKHFHGIDCEIVRDRLDVTAAVNVELGAGGAMFFSGMLPHQTPPNTSPMRRRALQLQYRGANTRKVEKEEYSLAFAEADGTPASCGAASRG